VNTHTPKFKIRLGIFVAIGIAIFIIAVFVIGKQKNLFTPIIKLTTTFRNISGLMVGNNIRFSGVNVGTVDDITIINDSTVKVDMIIQKGIGKFIKTDSKVAIGSEGLIGDRLLTISQGSADAPQAPKGHHLSSVEPIETDAILLNLTKTAESAEIITSELAEIMIKINSGEGTLGKLIQDTTVAENINQTIINLKKSSRGLNENMNAAKDNIFLRGYFRRKEAAKQKAIDKANNKDK
jgi:phospholipid/cholesterol/gamma-HCH transport system substrate-binding protein